MTLRAGEKAGKPVSICGEMAGDPKLTRLLIGLGLRKFSMQSASLLNVKQQVLTTHSNEAYVLAQKILKATDANKIDALMVRLNQ